MENTTAADYATAQDDRNAKIAGDLAQRTIGFGHSVRITRPAGPVAAGTRGTLLRFIRVGARRFEATVRLVDGRVVTVNAGHLAY